MKVLHTYGLPQTAITIIHHVHWALPLLFPFGLLLYSVSEGETVIGLKSLISFRMSGHARFHPYQDAISFMGGRSMNIVKRLMNLVQP